MRFWNRLFGRKRGSPGALLEAIHKGDLEKVQSLLEQGTDLNQHLAVEGRQWLSLPIVDAAELGHLEIVKALVRARADVNKGWVGYNAIHAAASKGHTEVVRFLLDHGAVAGRDRDGSRPIDYAKHGGHDETVAFLERRT